MIFSSPPPPPFGQCCVSISKNRSSSRAQPLRTGQVWADSISLSAKTAAPAGSARCGEVCRPAHVGPAGRWLGRLAPEGGEPARTQAARGIAIVSGTQPCVPACGCLPSCGYLMPNGAVTPRWDSRKLPVATVS
jgi:hypothetical protein